MFPSTSSSHKRICVSLYKNICRVSWSILNSTRCSGNFIILCKPPETWKKNLCYLVSCTVKSGIAPFPSIISAFYCSSSCLERVPHEGRECFRGKIFLEKHSDGCPSLGCQSTPQIIWLVLHPCWSNLDNWSTLLEGIQARLFCLILWGSQTPLWSPA